MMPNATTRRSQPIARQHVGNRRIVRAQPGTAAPRAPVFGNAETRDPAAIYRNPAQNPGLRPAA